MDRLQLKNYFDQLAATRDVWKGRNRYYHREIERLVRFLVPEDSSVLEIGCAAGDLLGVLNPRRGKGIDVSSEMVKIAQAKYPQFSFEVMDVEDLKLHEVFDFILLSDVIGFLSDIQNALGKIHQVCHSKSRMVITYYSYLWEPMLKLAEKLHFKAPQPWQSWVSPADLENFLYLSGFEIIKEGRRLLFPIHVPFLSQFLNRFVAQLPFIRELCLVYYVVARPVRGGALLEAPTVSVIVPARNEAGTIEEVVRRIPQLGRHTEIIFVEGHSRDHTLEKIKEVQAAFRTRDITWAVQSGVGKADAVRKGFDMAEGDILMILDADLTVAPEDLPKFYEALVDQKGELINGCRLVYPVEKEAMRFLNLIGNKFFSVMFTWLLDQRIKDTLCGTKALWRKDYDRIKKGRSYFGEFDPFGDFDLLFGASKLQLKIVDLPVRYMERTYGKTNISRWRHGVLLLQMVWVAMRKLKFF